MAQRDAGAKARGEFGAGPSSRSYSTWSGRAFSYRPLQAETESYRSFTYEPVTIEAGQNVVVRGTGVRMMKGSEVVATVPRDTEFQVTKVVNGWLGAVVEIDGQQLNGWIWHGNVSTQDRSVDTPQTLRQESTRSYRSFSYEPSEVNRPYRSSQRNKEPWRYLKTDPRRNR